MTKIYIYCLFDGNDNFYGAYSSLKAIYRDAVRIANQGNSKVYMEFEGNYADPSLTKLRNVLKGLCDVKVRYRSDSHTSKIIKTKLKE